MAAMRAAAFLDDGGSSGGKGKGGGNGCGDGSGVGVDGTEGNAGGACGHQKCKTR